MDLITTAEIVLVLHLQVYALKPFEFQGSPSVSVNQPASNTGISQPRRGAVTAAFPKESSTVNKLDGETGV